MERNPRIAVGGIFTECNHFGGPVIGRADFARYGLFSGDELLSVTTGVVAGAVEGVVSQRCDVVTLLYASACPCGLVADACYQELKSDLERRLSNQLPVDGVLLLLHGAMAAESVPDAEGDLIRAVRQAVGPTVPVVVTLDHHAQVTEEMVRHATALVAWETYPHRDAATTGRRGADLLAATLRGDCQPAMAMGHVPVVTGALLASTDGDGPFARLMRTAKELETRPEVLSTSLFLGHPYLDLPHMGSGAVVITNRDPDLAASLASQLAQAYWDSRFELEPETFTPQFAIQRGLELAEAPVVLVEAADCAGGGASGDSVATLRELLKYAPHESALVPVVDGAAAARCHECGREARLTLSLGHAHDPKWGTPLTVTGTVTHLLNGRFQYRGGIWDGVEGDMGPTAVLSVGRIQILITTYPTYDWRDEQYRAAGLEPECVKFVVVKNPMNYKQVYDSIAAATWLLDTPGPTPPSVRNVQFVRLKGAYFPKVEVIEGFVPQIFAGHATSSR